MIHEIKNLSIIDLNSLFLLSSNENNVYCITNNITNTKDIETLFKHFFYINFLNVYTIHQKQNILLYFHDKSDLEIKSINLIIKHLKNKFKFPLIISNITITDYLALINEDSPEYDEVINNNFNLIDIFSKFREHLRSSGLLFLNKKYKNLKDQLALLINKTPI